MTNIQRRTRPTRAGSASSFPPWVHWGWQLQNSYSFSSSVCTWDSHSPTSPSTKKHRFPHSTRQSTRRLLVHWPYFRWKFSAFPWMLCRTRRWNRASPWSHNPTRGTVTHRHRSLFVLESHNIHVRFPPFKYCVTFVSVFEIHLFWVYSPLLLFHYLELALVIAAAQGYERHFERFPHRIQVVFNHLLEWSIHTH